MNAVKLSSFSKLLLLPINVFHSNLIKSGLLTLVVSFTWLFSPAVYAFQNSQSENLLNDSEDNVDDKNSSSNVEVLSIYNNSRLSSIDDVFTSDNTLIFLQDSVSLDRTIADVITQTVGVELNGQGGLLQSYNMRGFSRDRIKTEVNGIPIITDRRAGNSISFIPTKLINSVYIQKGPSSSLYGSGAMGGVVSLSTLGNDNLIGVKLEPTDDFDGLTSQSVFGQYTNTTNNDSSINIGGVHRKAKATYSADNTPLFSQFEQTSLSVNTDFIWNNIDINASLIYSHGVNIGKSSSTFPDNRISDYPEDDHLLSQIQFSDQNDTWKLQFFQHKQYWQTDIVRLSDGDISRRNFTDYSSHTFGALATYALDQTLLGVEWNERQNINITEQEFDADNTFLWANTSVNADERNIGVYINHHWYINALTLNVGARYDTVSVKQNNDNNLDEQSATPASRVSLSNLSVNKDAFSASLNAQYAFENNTQLSAEIASSFRFPTVSELLFSGETPRGNTQGNPDLLSEKSMGYQLSLTHQFSPTIEGKINTYLYDIENYIERLTLSVDDGTGNNEDITGYKNSENVTIKGVELLATWQASQQFNSSLGLQWQQGKNQNNETVDDGLPAAIKWLFQWSPEVKGLNDFSIINNMSYRFTRNSFGPSEIELSKRLIWNTTASFKFNKQSEVALSVLNLMNENYKASSDEDAPFQPKRSIDLTFTWFY
ncbi:TonB-dependent receptor [Pseudocolwellia sp. HL-MZ19]|uniref:TonB-dependent receptor n=1 Tax=unclassified Pseudocolwellia TaxID=2848178 RepID=UPI003CF5772B